MRRLQRMMVLGMAATIMLGAIHGTVWGQAYPGQQPAGLPGAVPFFPTPRSATLCGEPVPLDSQWVLERFDREFTIVVYSHAQVYLWLKRMERYFPWLEAQLRLYKLPDDLKYVAVAESDLMLSACSPAGAVGPWQFIPSTGRSYGLSQSSNVDERHDFQMASTSAFRYLSDLHDTFQNWTLAIAAYNCGEGRVKEEIARQRISTYYDLKLPMETERYIFRILAIKAVLSEPEKYGYHLPKGEGYPELQVDRVSVNLPDSMPMQLVADAADITFREFKMLNPCFVSDTIPAGSYTMLVPQGKGGSFEMRLETIKQQYVPRIVSTSAGAESGSRTHKVKKGETLSGIAARYGVSVQELRRWNKIKGNAVRIGQSLVVRN